MTLQWVDIPPTPEFIGPPKPASCVAGWESHTWIFTLDDGNTGLHTDECRLCNDGAEEIGIEYLAGEFPVTIEFRKETYGSAYEGTETDVWWDITPITTDKEPEQC